MRAGPRRYKWRGAAGVLVGNTDPGLLQRRVAAARSAMRRRDQSLAVRRRSAASQHADSALEARSAGQRVVVRFVSDTGVG